MTSPPASTTMIFRPERYAPTLPPGPDYSDVLHGIEEILTAGPWTTVRSAVAEYDLRLEAQRYDQQRVDELLSHLVRGCGLNAVRPDREANVRVLDFDAIDHAVAYVRFIRDQAEAAAAMETGGFGLSVAVGDYDRIASDIGVERVLGPAGSDTPSLEHRSVWVVRGSRVVEVSVRGFRPGLRMQAALGEVFTRLEREAPSPQEHDAPSPQEGDASSPPEGEAPSPPEVDGAER